ncbi:MAG TPA: class I SAM-dependent methyltransferase [Kouleothrix sp.]|uniref:class I SAM-dependent methyltransferase n=1 Tax=Kouleothrix sp. TaxID=2779161 RepID=UPI002C02336C|nr:class I SAM-dependent methyltransferase [Kouleothrix sp.]HRC76336.1 class I SAM-dependent methyltransferase [Kouleothrix sp.]
MTQLLPITPHFAAYYRSLLIADQLGLPARAARVLDVGCDDGYIMSRVDAPLRLGVDVNPRLRPSDAVAVARASATALPALAGTFDCILAFDVLEHVADDRAMMREMLRVLAPEGTLWFTTPALGFRMFPAWLTPYTNRSFGHVRNGYTPEQLGALLPDAERYSVEFFFWNEPALRLLFAPLHFLNLAAPSAAAALARLCYRLDSAFHEGRRGHLLGRVRHRAAAS